MRYTRSAMVATVILSAGVGALIAGLPAGEPPSLMIDISRGESADVPRTTVAAGRAEPASTTITSTEPLVSAPDETIVTDERDGETTTTAARPPLVERALLTVVVANGTNFPGVAGRTAAILEEGGYVDVGAVDAELSARTTIFHLEGFGREARRVAIDLELDRDTVGFARMDEAPPVVPAVDAQILLVSGTDRL